MKSIAVLCLSFAALVLPLVLARTPLYIGALFPMTSLHNDSWTGGRGILPAAQIALDHVNNASVLAEFELRLIWDDTRGFSGWAAHALYQFLYSSPRKIMLLGAGFSSCSTAVAAMAGLDAWRIPQISYASTSPQLSDKGFYPYFYRTIPEDSSFNEPRMSILETFNWKHIATIFQEEDIHRAAMSDLRLKFRAQEVTQISSESFRDDASIQMKNIKDKGSRIIVGNFFGKGAREVFCEAYKLKMYGPKYVWIILGYIEKEWWNTIDSNVDCTAEQMFEAMDGHLATDHLYHADQEKRTVSGQKVADFFTEYNRRVTHNDSDQHGNYAYDAVWAMALALNRSISKLPPAIRLDELEYGDKAAMDVITDSLLKTDFYGITGPVGFTVKGDRIGDAKIVQMKDGVYKQVGLYEVAERKVNWTGYVQISWKGGIPPRDRSIYEYKLISVSLALFTFMVTVALLCMMTSFFFLWFNIKYRAVRCIKMSSPNLNNAIILGSVLSYLSVIIFGLDGNLVSSGYEIICTSRAWSLSLAFSMAYGAMFSKTWRVHLIFMNKKLKRKVIKDRHLLGVVMLLIIIDVIYLITWQVLDPQQRAIQEFPEEDVDISTDISVVKQLEHCESEDTYRWIGVLCAYKGLLLLFGAFLAWETRKVTIPALNDSRYIGLSVYNVFILSVIGAPMSLLLREHPNASFCIVSLCIILCTSITLCFVFIPKMLEMRRNMSVGEQIRRTFTSSTCPGEVTGSINTIDSSLRAQFQDYQRKMDEKNEEIRELRRRIQDSECRHLGGSDVACRQSADVMTRADRQGGSDVACRQPADVTTREDRQRGSDVACRQPADAKTRGDRQGVSHVACRQPADVTTREERQGGSDVARRQSADVMTREDRQGDSNAETIMQAPVC